MKYITISISTVLVLAAACTTTDHQNKNVLNLMQPIAQPIAEQVEPQHDEVPTATSSSLCPDDMVEISGNYCPDVIQECLNLDMSVHNANGFVRCLEFAPTKCMSPNNKKINMHFCMDKFEYPNKEGIKPDIMITWYDVKKGCEEQNKRLCVDNEWTLACEGPDMLPYPYGLKRDVNACNIDHPQRPWFDASKSAMTPDIVEKLDQRVTSGSMPACVSYYGVHDMTGNVDEYVVNSSGKPYVSGLKGGHWVIGARNKCRPETLAHGPTTVFYEIGGRCCKDIK